MCVYVLCVYSTSVVQSLYTHFVYALYQFSSRQKSTDESLSEMKQKFYSSLTNNKKKKNQIIELSTLVLT